MKAGKIIGILLMIVVIGVFSWFTFQKVTDDGEDFSLSKITSLFKKNKGEASLEDIATQLDTNYPNQVKEVMELYNQLLNLYYRGKLTDAQLETYVIATRKIYSNELNHLNPIEQQKEALKNEETGQPVAYQVQDIYIQRDKNDKDVRAEVVILYATNSGSFMRNYNLIKEDGLWKINSWKDYAIDEEKAQ